MLPRLSLCGVKCIACSKGRRGQLCRMFSPPNPYGAKAVACSPCRTSAGPKLSHVRRDAKAEPRRGRVPRMFPRAMPNLRASASHVLCAEPLSGQMPRMSLRRNAKVELLRGRACRTFPMLNLCGAERNGRFPMPKSCQAECLARSKRR